MSGDHREEGRRFARFMESMAPERRAEISRLEHEDNERIHAEFRSAFAAGRCSLCDEQLDSFLPKKPCHHWLLKPVGFTKRDFEKVTAEYGVFQLQSYLRWVANEAAFAQNITDQGDLSTTDGKLIEVTIRYNQLEWSFSCGQNDYLGHQSARKGAFPHYHFQMRINGRPFINYNDFHIPLSKMDVINIEAVRSSPNVRHRFSHGEAIQDVMVDEYLPYLIETPVADRDEATAPFKLDTFIIAEEGKTISGDDIHRIIQEAKAKGVTISSLAHTVPNAISQVIVSEGPGVVEPAPRSPRRKKGDASD